MRCLERSTDEEKLRLQEHADPMEDIIEEDLDCGTANSLEEAAGFFSEHESEDELLPPKGQRDYLNLSLWLYIFHLLLFPSVCPPTFGSSVIDLGQIFF